MHVSRSCVKNVARADLCWAAPKVWLSFCAGVPCFISRFTLQMPVNVVPFTQIIQLHCILSAQQKLQSHLHIINNTNKVFLTWTLMFEGCCGDFIHVFEVPDRFTQAGSHDQEVAPLPFQRRPSSSYLGLIYSLNTAEMDPDAPHLSLLMFCV